MTHSCHIFKGFTTFLFKKSQTKSTYPSSKRKISLDSREEYKKKNFKLHQSKTKRETKTAIMKTKFTQEKKKKNVQN